VRENEDIEAGAEEANYGMKESTSANFKATSG